MAAQDKNPLDQLRRWTLRDRRIMAERAIAAGDESARSALVEASLLWARRRGWAACARMRTVERMDVIQAATLAMIEAATTYDATRGISFLAYASDYVTSAISEELRSQSRRLSIPRDAETLQVRMNRFVASQRAIGGDPTVAEIAAHLGITEARVRDVMQGDWDRHDACDPISPAMLVSDGSAADTIALRRERQEAVRRVLRLLHPRDLELVQRVYGMGYRPHTIEDAADAVGLGRSYAKDRLVSIRATLRAWPALQEHNPNLPD